MLYDSGYAANMVAGRWQPNTNTNVVQWARGLLAEVEKTRTVHWVHVKGHSGDGTVLPVPVLYRYRTYSIGLYLY